ncbi:Lipid A export ATP-binding/permease protein MsbA [Porphyromonas levii]|nr:Lipid A export ATP-binding/permease protein MsbA [Porphyromonas levii]
MDEATSALDSKSEQYVKDAIVRMKQEGRTILIITHRLGTITDADKIVVLDDGKVVAEGVHSNLMENSEVYKRLFHLQMTGSI